MKREFKGCINGSDLYKDPGSNVGNQREAPNGHVLCWYPVPAPVCALAALGASCCGFGCSAPCWYSCTLVGLSDRALLQFSLSTTPPCSGDSH